MAAIVIIVACVCIIALVVLMIAGAAVAIAIAKGHAGCNVGERQAWVAAMCTHKSGNE
jgi:hypothetical protein